MPSPDSSMTPAAHFAPTAAAVRDARLFVAGVVRATDGAGRRLALLVSELATNAVLHAETSFVVAVRQRGDLVRVDVVDGCELLPLRKPYPLRAPTGRGLDLVDAIAADWGVERRPGGKSVWFTLDLACDEARR